MYAETILAAAADLGLRWGQKRVLESSTSTPTDVVNVCVIAITSISAG